MTKLAWLEALLPTAEAVNDDIRASRSADYVNCLESLVHDFSEFPGVLGVGQYGRIRVLGVSDLDIVVVCRDGVIRSTASAIERAVTSTHHCRYLLAHRVALVPHSLVSSVSVLRTFDHLQVHAGSLHGLDDDAMDGWSVRAFRAAIWNGFFWMATLRQARSPSVSLRRLLLLLWNGAIAAAAEFQLAGDAESGSRLLSEVHVRRSRSVELTGSARIEAALAALRYTVVAWANASTRLARSLRAETRADPTLAFHVPASIFDAGLCPRARIGAHYVAAALSLDALAGGVFGVEAAVKSLGPNGSIPWPGGVPEVYAESTISVLEFLSERSLDLADHGDIFVPVLGRRPGAC